MSFLNYFGLWKLTSVNAMVHSALKQFVVHALYTIITKVKLI